MPLPSPITPETVETGVCHKWDQSASGPVMERVLSAGSTTYETVGCCFLSPAPPDNLQSNVFRHGHEYTPRRGISSCSCPLSSRSLHRPAHTAPPMLAHTKRRPPPLVLVAFFILLFIYHRNSHAYFEWTTRHPEIENPPANATLGFGAVLVVARKGSSRLHSLLQAANVTDIDLTIPQQPPWNDNDVDEFRNGQDVDVHKGSILAWMGHRHVLHW